MLVVIPVEIALQPTWFRKYIDHCYSKYINDRKNDPRRKTIKDSNLYLSDAYNAMSADGIRITKFLSDTGPLGSVVTCFEIEINDETYCQWVLKSN